MRLRLYILLLFTLTYCLPTLSQIQTGKASYYSKKWTGRRTASGTLVHHDSMTCAHRTYPFGTLLKVTNKKNGRQVTVRVTDRGPFGRGRIVDLSWGAAKAIGMLADGVVPVTVERVEAPPSFIFDVEDDMEEDSFSLSKIIGPCP